MRNTIIQREVLHEIPNNINKLHHVVIASIKKQLMTFISPFF